MRTPTKFCILLTVMLSTVTQAQDDTPDSQIDMSKVPILGPVNSHVPIPGTVNIRGIIAAYSARTHKRFILDPRVQTEVGLFGMEVKDITYPQLLTILQVHGYFAHEQDGLVVVAPDAGERQSPTPLALPGDNRAADAEVVTSIVVVKNINAAQLVPVLRPLMPQEAQLSAVTGINVLIIADRAANVRRLVALIEALDRLPLSTHIKSE